MTAFSYESAPILPLYYKRPVIDGRHVELDLDPEDHGVTTARATTEGKEQRHRKLRAEIGAGVFKRNGGMTACMCMTTVCVCMCMTTACVYLYD